MFDISVLILAATNGLSIKKPVRVSLLTHETRKMDTCMGMCDTLYRKGKIQYHKITISLRNCAINEYPVSDVILHELVHASMIEHNKFDNNWHHDTTFQNICKVLETEMRKLGFTVGELYSPVTDID